MLSETITRATTEVETVALITVMIWLFLVKRRHTYATNDITVRESCPTLCAACERLMGEISIAQTIAAKRTV
jgi:hypothetical protein